MITAHFPPFTTVHNCTTCLGFGCNDCCHTGTTTTVPNQEQFKQSGDMLHTLDTPEREVSQVCDTADIPPDTTPDIPLALDVPQEWDIMIRRASNGFIVRGWVENDYDNGVQFTDTLIEDDATDPAPLRLLWEVIEQLGFTGSRHDAKRIFVGYRPGDKHHDYHPRPCAECECGCEPDQSTQEEER